MSHRRRNTGIAIVFVVLVSSVMATIVLASFSVYQSDGPTLLTSPNAKFNVMVTGGTYLYISTTDGKLMKVDSVTGSIIVTVTLAAGGVDSLFWDGKYVYAGTTAPAAIPSVYKMDENLKIIALMNIPHRSGVARLLVLSPGGNVYLSTGGSKAYEFDPTLKTRLATLSLGHSSGDDIEFDGKNIWWMTRYGFVTVTDTSLLKVATGTPPSGVGLWGGMVVLNGVAYVGNGNGTFYKLTISGTLVVPTPVVTVDRGAVSKQVQLVGGQLFIPISRFPGVIDVFEFPSFALIGRIRMPDGLGIGEVGGTGQYGLVALGSTVYVVTTGHIYDISDLPHDAATVSASFYHH